MREFAAATYRMYCGQNTKGPSISKNKADSPIGKHQETEEIRKKKRAHRKAMNAWKAHPEEEAILHAPGRQSLALQLAAMEMRRKVKDFTSHIINE